MTSNTETVAEKLVACFQDIADSRMDGVPVLNREIRVEAVGTRAFGDGHITILVTPWFMNIIIQADEDGEAVRTGTKKSFALPAGRFEFIRGHEDAVGAYWMCSLYSPMFEFGDHETAVATAEAAMSELFGDEIEADDDERDMAMMWRGEIPVRPPAVEDEGDADGADAASGSAEADPAEDGMADPDAVPAELSRRDLFRRFRPSGTTGEEQAG